MYSVGHILVPVDFSPNSEAALRYALYHTSHWGSRVDLLYVADGDREISSRSVETRLEEMLRHYSLAERSLVRCIVASGEPAPEIVRAAADHDLVVMGGRGLHSSEDRGSTTRAVLRDCSCSVIPVWQAEQQSGFDFELGPTELPTGTPARTTPHSTEGKTR